MNRTYDITYSCPSRTWEQATLVNAMIQDLLYGQTFRVSHSCEETIPLCRRSFRDHIQKRNRHGRRQWFSVKVPARQFSSGRLSAWLVQLWGNILDYQGMRLEELDSDLLHEVRPKRRQEGRRRLSDRQPPLFATVLKPSWGLSLKDRVNMAREFISLGGDFVKEDETYTPCLSQLISDVSAIQDTLDTLQSDGRGLGVYVPNITAWITKATAIKQLRDVGMRAGMIAFFAAGLDAVHDFASSQADECFLWGHRVGYESMSKSLSVTAMAQLAFAAGLDGLHIGTPILGRASTVERTARAVDSLRSLSLREGELVLPIFSKTTHPILSPLFQHYGREAIIVGCGEFHKKGCAARDKNRILSWLRGRAGTEGKPPDYE